MAINKGISVWLFIEDGKDKGKIALQKRSSKSKTFPYVCQGTWAGKVEADESLKTAVKRECKEELGRKFFGEFEFSKLKLFAKSIFFVNKKKCTCYNYFGWVGNKILGTAELHKEAFPKFIIAGKKDKFYPIESGKDPKNNIVFFDDQYEAIRRLPWN